MEAEAIVREMADDTGMVSPDSTQVTEPETDIDVNINIRQDDIQLFETETGRQLLRTEEMDSGVYVEPVPSPDGFIAEIVVQPEVEFAETSPADPAEQPEVSRGQPVEIRMD